MSTWFCLRASTCIYIIYIKLHIGVVQLRARCRVNTISSLNIDIYIYMGAHNDMIPMYTYTYREIHYIPKRKKGYSTRESVPENRY